jgi:cytochrome P450
MAIVYGAQHGARKSSPKSSILQSLLLRWRLLNYRLQCTFLNHPLALKLAFALLRRLRPIPIVGKVGSVTKARDVRDVLYRLEDFNNAEMLSAKMPWGPFVVDIDWPERHDRERELLESIVVKPGDIARIRQDAAAICQVQVNAARRSGNEIDVVSALCEPVVVDMVQRYFGIPVMGPAHDVARVLSQIASTVMVEAPPASRQWHDARASMISLTGAILEQIAQVPQTQPNDLLGRLVAKLRSGKRNPPGFDEAWIRRYITGLTVFGGGTVVRAATQAIDRLMAHPAGLRRARDLAKQIQLNGGAAANVLQTARCELLQIIYEALRFRPMLPLLPRYVPRETMIAKGASHARMAPAGCLMLVPPLAAMYDPEEFPHPWSFSSHRCLKNYVHFGHGPRLCFGKYIADELFVEIFRALLLLDDLKRAPGSRGRLKYDGPAVKSLVLTFNR